MVQPIPKPKKRRQKRSRVVDRQALKDAVKEQCEVCDRVDLPLQIHHIVYKSQGGGDIPSNLICICSRCHDRAHFKIKDEPLAREFLQYIKEGNDGLNHN